jgi:hypothetical protein
VPQARVMAHLALSMMTRSGTPPNHSKARRWQPSQVATVWSQTNSTYWWRLWHRVMTNAQVRRGLPSGCVSTGPAPKSTWAASPGEVSAAGGLGRQLARRMSGHPRRTAE